MSTYFCITVRWIGDRFHGFIDGTESIEWPPSPFRLFEALLAGAHRHGMNETRRDALAWIERQASAPEVLAVADPATGTLFDHWVPDNDNQGDHRKGSIRRFKPILLADRPLVHYVWGINPADSPPIEALDDLTSTLGWLGWAIDSAYATVTFASGELLDSKIFPDSSLSRFRPLRKTTQSRDSLRVPKEGSTADLERIHGANRISFADQAQRRKKLWPKVFDRFIYASDNHPPKRPHAVFKLVDADDDTVTYAQSKLVHIAGMVKHAAIEAMKRNPPRDLCGRSKDEWVEAYVAGHQSKEDKGAGAAHTQFSYIPLQSLGHANTDPGVRRVMIVAPIGDDAWLEHLAVRLDGVLLKPLPNTKLPPGTQLKRIPDNLKDGVRDAHLTPANVWASVTPVILPGHDDHKPEKTRKLIEKALAQSGIDQPCAFEWSAFSQFRKMLPAHKYRRDPSDPSKKILINYVRPDHLLDQSAVHLTLRFANDLKVPGPLTLGAGRHCGFGLMAGVE